MTRPLAEMAAGVLAALWIAGCGGSITDDDDVTHPEDDDADDDDDDATDYSLELFDPDHLVQVHIEIDPDDAAALAAETTSILDLVTGADCLDGPLGAQFTWFSCEATVDGTTLPDVGIRKKGLIGSLSETKPGLKLKFDKWVDGQTLHGVERMTLNNSVSDPSLLRQCLGYALFAEAGIAAPRCNYAHVTVNEFDLGIYVNVEPVKKDLLRRTYDDEDGDLYEGTLSDFRAGWTETFEPKTSDTDPSRACIHEVVEALNAPDDQLEAALEPYLDLDSFLTFWAMEVLVAHLDGYAGNTNNFFVYRDPTSDRLTFIPWGIDATFHHWEVWGFDTSDAVLANGMLTNRLFFHDEIRAQYLHRLQTLLDGVWDEDALLDEIDRMDALVSAEALDDPWRDGSVEELREFVLTRQETVEASIDAGPVWELDLPGPPCMVPAGELGVTFDTTWGTLETADPLNTGSGTVQGNFYGDDLPPVTGGALAGEYGGQALILSLGMASATDVVEGAVLFELSSVQPGTYFLDAGLRVGYYMTLDTQTQSDFQFAAYVAGGDLILEEASASPGSTIRGSFGGDLLVPVEKYAPGEPPPPLRIVPPTREPR